MLIMYLDVLADFGDEDAPQHGAVLHLKSRQLDGHILKVGHVQTASCPPTWAWLPDHQGSCTCMALVYTCITGMDLQKRLCLAC